MQHLDDLILERLPGIDVRVTNYPGPLIGYGWYEYSNSKGPAGEWFTAGIANRKAYISLYSMGTRDGRNLVEAVSDRFPGVKHGRSCLTIEKPELVDDDAVHDLVRESREIYKDRSHRPSA